MMKKLASVPDIKKKIIIKNKKVEKITQLSYLCSGRAKVQYYIEQSQNPEFYYSTYIRVYLNNSFITTIQRLLNRFLPPISHQSALFFVGLYVAFSVTLVHTIFPTPLSFSLFSSNSNLISNDMSRISFAYKLPPVWTTLLAWRCRVFRAFSAAFVSFNLVSYNSAFLAARQAPSSANFAQVWRNFLQVWGHLIVG